MQLRLQLSGTPTKKKSAENRKAASSVCAPVRLIRLINNRWLVNRTRWSSELPVFNSQSARSTHQQDKFDQNPCVLDKLLQTVGGTAKAECSQKFWYFVPTLNQNASKRLVLFGDRQFLLIISHQSGGWNRKRSTWTLINGIPNLSGGWRFCFLV